MRLVFAGTPEFAERALSGLLDAGHEIALVLTQPDRPAGRGQKPRSSPVKTLALARGLPVAQPERLREPAAQAQIAAVHPEVLVVAAYGLILPVEVLAIGQHGALNIHASLLPRWRGAAPIQRALLAGDRESGISIMQMDEGLDTGPVVSQARFEIDARMTGGMLHDALAQLGARMIVEALRDLATGDLISTPQPDTGVTYAHKISRDERIIDWRNDAQQIDRQIRAFSPSPGAVTSRAGRSIKVLQARVVTGAGTPGEILVADGRALVIACGREALSIEALQLAGARRAAVRDYLHGHRDLAPGERWGTDGADR